MHQARPRSETAPPAPATFWRARAAVPVLGALVLVLFVVSLGTGPVAIAPGDVLATLTGSGTEAERIIILELRLPRAILALAIGAFLGLSGAALQGLLRNPLAAPSLFGAPQA
ncbi:MAG: iron ABC transporter permease, partial [Methylacidiphilales bacterium]|nr:iron ABC transporter permease [Candidatus Methylacidiphilales bacterium]